MCVIIDVNCIGKVFDQKNAEYQRFQPVHLWVMTGDGSVIYGGTKYLKELGEGKYLNLFTELLKVRRAIKINSESVDKRAVQLKIRVPDDAFDDEHIVALVGISRCCVVCTDDVNSLPYLKRRDLYPSGVKVPKIYRSIEDKKLCSSRLMSEICPSRLPQRRRNNKKPKSRPKIHLKS